MTCSWSKTLAVTLLPLVAFFANASNNSKLCAQDTSSAQPTSADKTEQEHGAEIHRLILAQDLDGAVLAWRGAVAGHPNSAELWSRGVSVASFLLRNGQPELADSIVSEVVDGLIPLVANNQVEVTTLNSALAIGINIAVQTSKEDQALDRFAKAIEALEAQPEAVDHLRISRVSSLLMLRRIDEALAQANEGTDAASNRLQNHPDDVSSRLSLVSWSTLKASAYGQAKPDDKEGRIELLQQAASIMELEFVKSHVAEKGLFPLWATTHLQLFSAIGESDPQQAIDRLATFKTELATIVADLDPAPESLVGIERQINASEQRLTIALKHQTLLGQPSIPVLPAAWVNGTALTPEELKGKVVLLDFWAVWCGPCIATFPHLRDWNQRFADQGLVTIGVTRYYRYSWDATTSRAIRMEELSQEAEHEALEQFAAHHELKHVFAVTETSELQQFYGVTGIPQAVLIDREGRVRMIKVGSGEANAQALEAMIEQLLQE